MFCGFGSMHGITTCSGGGENAATTLRSRRCPRGEFPKKESEMWENLGVRGRVRRNAPSPKSNVDCASATTMTHVTDNNAINKMREREST